MSSLTMSIVWGKAVELTDGSALASDPYLEVGQQRFGSFIAAHLVIEQ